MKLDEDPMTVQEVQIIDSSRSSQQLSGEES
jgi:hypothetical protein